MHRFTRSRGVKVAVLTPMAMLLMIATAFALEQTNGTGKTNAGNTIGYNVKCLADLAPHSLDGKYACPKVGTNADASSALNFQANGPTQYIDPTYGVLDSITCNTATQKDPSPTTVKSYVYKRVSDTVQRTRVVIINCVAKFPDSDGGFVYVPAFVKIYFYDAGEPGTSDRILFYATLDPTYKKNAELDPNRLVTDASGQPHGLIQNGNVQIHTEVDPTTLANTLNTDMLVDCPETGCAAA